MPGSVLGIRDIVMYKTDLILIYLFSSKILSLTSAALKTITIIIITA